MARKKTSTDRLELRLPPASLHREELEQIVGFVSQLGEPVSITTEEHELDSIADLAETYDKKIKKFQISVGNWSAPGYLDVTLYSEPWFLEHNHVTGGGATNPQLRGVAEQVADVVERRRPFINKFANSGLFIVAMLLVGVISLGPIETPDWLALAIYAGFLLFAVNYYGTSIINKTFRRVGVYPYYRSDRAPNFFQRNMDALLVNLIVGLVLFVLGYITGQLR